VTYLLDDIDRKIVVATQDGLPLTPRPYHDVAEGLGLEPDDVMARMTAMLEGGAIRRMGVVPNHYALGVRANGMSVWNVADEKASSLGPQIGALGFVSHAYRRPRYLPEWPYNLFAMVHGKTRLDVEAHVENIARLLGDDDLGHEILYSTRILKKKGLRLSEKRK
jgi:siroheme decarboxylase